MYTLSLSGVTIEMLQISSILITLPFLITAADIHKFIGTRSGIRYHNPIESLVSQRTGHHTFGTNRC